MVVVIVCRLLILMVMFVLAGMTVIAMVVLVFAGVPVVSVMVLVLAGVFVFTVGVRMFVCVPIMDNFPAPCSRGCVSACGRPQ